jgi:hypothetical protein
MAVVYVRLELKNESVTPYCLVIIVLLDLEYST